MKKLLEGSVNNKGAIGIKTPKLTTSATIVKNKVRMIFDLSMI